MKIGIIGCGYVGQAAALNWKKKNYYISVTTRQPERIATLSNCSDQVCVLKDQSLTSFIAQQDALLISVAPDHFSQYESTYLSVAHAVANHVKNNPSLKQIIYTSSTSVYGDNQGNWVDENALIFPQEIHTKILHEAEKILLNCASEHLKVCILRLGEIYGPNREIENRLRQRQNQPFPGTGDSYTNLIHLTDIVEALDFALTNGLKGIYNLCNDFHILRRIFYHDICQKEQIPPIKWDPQLRSLHGGNRRVSNQKIKDKGFIFTYPNY